MSNPASDIADILSGSAVDDNSDPVAGILTLGTDLFANIIQDDGVDEQILILDTAGLVTDQDASYTQPTVQVYGRGKRGEGVVSIYDKMFQTRDFLFDLPSVAVNGSRYTGFYIQGDIGHLGIDEEGRHQYSMNFRCYR